MSLFRKLARDHPYPRKGAPVAVGARTLAQYALLRLPVDATPSQVVAAVVNAVKPEGDANVRRIPDRA